MEEGENGTWIVSIERGVLSSTGSTASAAATNSPNSWSEALRARGGGLRPPASPDPGGDPRDEASPPDASRTSRRSFIRMSFWAGLGVSLLGAAGTAVDFLYPRNVAGFGGPVPIGEASAFVRGGAPVLMREAQAWVVHLDPSQDRLGGAGGGAGLLALWQRCPHLGCAVPWQPQFSFQGDDGGWFRCPCHRSTYTKAGVRVDGPAPRSMDTMLIEVDANGLVTVQTGVITNGGPDNPSRALPV